ncbi:RecQ family ATP-dependent DNA helicase [Crateriforma conspicua]|uniref:DNA 3'-5' helicase n=1 Tax=Crateriforma conspicua TaxID=2527996 RepID=A0A5C6FPI3_9PLAN|nr:ATP-dependent DNA helicase RecQ [Crateriforma conspicua]TWU63194.1 ATP-dependent DNA helicase RecQ [Crateriforma conspicua]
MASSARSTKRSTKSASGSVDPPASPRPIGGDPREVLRDTFGLPHFRDGQYAVIDRLLAGKNVAAVFPTGGGKSLCYQLPSQMLPGVTVVVSPLIALMKDQCDSLAARGVAAARSDSGLTPAEFRAASQGVRDGSIKILFVSPERFFNERFLASIDGLPISLFAIDEAHCISQWGHNFRPDYLKLAGLTRRLGAERVLALTATATPEVLADIRDAFDIAPDDCIQTPFHRPNLRLRSSLHSAEQQYSALADRIRSRPRGSTLVYVTLQKTAEEVAERLTADGIPATAYHAGLDKDERQAIQQAFVQDDDAIVVATIAFGMGIDKSNLRYVYHFNPPKSMESYAQEIGRAGRDGKPATCEMLLVPEDRVVLENFVYGDTPSRHAVGRFIDLVAGQADTFHVSHYRLSSESDIRVLVIRTLLTYLELEGHLQATSPRFDSYKIKPLVTSQAILKHFDGERRQFVAGILSSLTKGRTWFTLNMVLATQRLGGDRQRIVKALDHMAEQGWMELQATELVHGYRWIKRLDDRKTVADDLFDRLARREEGEVRRIDEVYHLAAADRCMAATLAQHFGQSLEDGCGQCSHCTGDAAGPVPATKPRPLGSSVARLLGDVTKQYPDQFTHTRDKARFLCGLSSPALIRSRLTRHAGYGVCQHLPFAHVLEQLDG